MSLSICYFDYFTLPVSPFAPGKKYWAKAEHRAESRYKCGRLILDFADRVARIECFILHRDVVMAGFKVHVATAFAASVSFASYISAMNGFPIAWGGLLCGLGVIGGLLPDIDSGETKIARYSGFLIGVVLSIVASSLLHNYILVFVFLVPFIKLTHFGIQKWTTHRGVFHSIPMGFLLSIGAFYLSDLLLFPHAFSLYCAGFLGGGYLIHLVLDELWSLRKGMSKHCSFGTALQVFRMVFWKSFAATYALLGVVVYRTPALKVWIQKIIGLA